MDIFNTVQWNALFGYFLHDCSTLVLICATTMTSLAIASRLWLEEKRGTRQ